MEWIEKDSSTVRGFLSGSDILKYPNITINNDFLKFQTHDIANYPDWIIRLKHKRPKGVLTRPRLFIGKRGMHGMHIGLIPTNLMFYSWATVMEHATQSSLTTGKKCTEIDFSYDVPYATVEKQVYIDRVVTVEKEVEKPVWRTEVKYVEKETSFEDALKRENERLLANLGDWRPETPKYDMSNVIPLEITGDEDELFERMKYNV
jgi:hypothetical protein